MRPVLDRRCGRLLPLGSLGTHWCLFAGRRSQVAGHLGPDPRRLAGPVLVDDQRLFEITSQSSAAECAVLCGVAFPVSRLLAPTPARISCLASLTPHLTTHIGTGTASPDSRFVLCFYHIFCRCFYRLQFRPTQRSRISHTNRNQWTSMSSTRAAFIRTLYTMCMHVARYRCTSRRGHHRGCGCRAI